MPSPLLSSSALKPKPKLRPRPRRWQWDSAVPPILRPAVRAFLLGYAYNVAPRVASIVIRFVVRQLRESGVGGLAGPGPGPKPTAAATDFVQQTRKLLRSLVAVLRGGFDPYRLPTFCGALVGVGTLIQHIVKPVFDRIVPCVSDPVRQRLVRFLAYFTSGWLAMRLLLHAEPDVEKAISNGSNGTQAPGFSTKELRPLILVDGMARAGALSPRLKEEPTAPLGGKTIDLTCLTVTRGLDVLVVTLWRYYKKSRLATGKWTPLEALLEYLGDPLLFSVSSALVMWAWFYHPDALPPEYNKWITRAAKVDGRLIEALRRCRSGALVYGQETGQADLLGSMCVDYNLPYVWGDPARTIPFPCELVHMGVGPSCEKHAISRFLRALPMAGATYVPLTLLLLFRSPSKLKSSRALLRALRSAARSSCFLASFIALFYYGVCLARTRIGPRLLLPLPPEYLCLPSPPTAQTLASKSYMRSLLAARQRIDSGLCVATGCVMCGLSILWEKSSKRKDFALFVAPKALATLLPRRFEKEWEVWEEGAFAASVAAVLTAAEEEGGGVVRGWIGGLVGWCFGGNR